MTIKKSRAGKKIVVVLGCHRSGTSAITRGLQALGVDLGDHLLNASKDNITGFWEDQDIFHLNESLLHKLGTSWHRHHPIGESDIAELLEGGDCERACQLLGEKIDKAEIFGFKDPRTAILLPFWQEVFRRLELEDCYLISIRNPLSVADSLFERDGFYREKSQLLWIKHYLGAVLYTQGKRRVVVDYDLLLEAPERQLMRIAAALNLHSPASEALSDYSGNFLKKSLRHNRADAERLESDVSVIPFIKSAYGWLFRVALDEFDLAAPLFRRGWPIVEKGYMEFQHIFRYLDQLEKEVQIYRHCETGPEARMDKENLMENILLKRMTEKRDQEIKRLQREMERQSLQIELLTAQSESLSDSIDQIHRSTSWWVTAPLRSVKRQSLRVGYYLDVIAKGIQLGGGIAGTIAKAVKILADEGAGGIKRRIRFVQHGCRRLEGVDFFDQPFAMVEKRSYDDWINRFDTISDASRVRFLNAVEGFRHHPLISVVMPVYNPPVELLDQAIRSVRGQLYPYWELCIADDRSTDPEVIRLLKKHVEEDARIKVTYRRRNGHISEASNSALKSAKGEFIALLDHDDLLSEHALFWVASEINENPGAMLIYSDEDKIDETGRRHDPYFKCDWNPDLFLSQNLICHMGVYRTELIRRIGGFRKGFEGSQDHDLALRVVEKIDSSQIRHIPRILYHWRVREGSTALSVDEKPYAIQAGERAINEFLLRNSVPARAESLGYGYRVRYRVPDTEPKVSLIIPSRNNAVILKRCIESILEKTRYENFEILIVNNGSDQKETLNYLETVKRHERIRILDDPRPFNYSALNNGAITHASGDIIGLLNDDTEVIEPDWMGEMVSHAVRPEVGAVGAYLLYPDHSSQHSGVILGVGGVAGHAFKMQPENSPGYFARGLLIQSLSAVTGACLFVRKEVYLETGGLNEEALTVAFNDVDFCLRLLQKGYRNIWTPYAKLFHHESKSRGLEDTSEKRRRFEQEIKFMQEAWGGLLNNDPAYNPNLTLSKENFDLAFPPRVDHVL
ncbi:MAG: glycosyltransferase [Gammaproteobacteria bacterium]